MQIACMKRGKPTDCWIGEYFNEEEVDEKTDNQNFCPVPVDKPGVPDIPPIPAPVIDPFVLPPVPDFRPFHGLN